MTTILGAVGILILIPIAWKMIPERIEPTARNKKIGHIFFFLGDLLGLWLLWTGYSEIKEVIDALHDHADFISFSSRVGFYMAGLFILISHIFIVVNSLYPVIEKKYRRLADQCCIVALISFFAAGFLGSSCVKASVERAGYIYCRNASGISALARTLVYAKDIEVCENLVEERRKP